MMGLKEPREAHKPRYAKTSVLTNQLIRGPAFELEVWWVPRLGHRNSYVVSVEENFLKNQEQVKLFIVIQENVSQAGHVCEFFLFGNPPPLQDKRNFVSLADALAWVRAALLVQTLGMAVWCSAKSAKLGFFSVKGTYSQVGDCFTSILHFWFWTLSSSWNLNEFACAQVNAFSPLNTGCKINPI